MMGIGGWAALPVIFAVYLVPVAVMFVALYFVVRQAVYAGIKKFHMEEDYFEPAQPEPPAQAPGASAPEEGGASDTSV